MTVSMSACVSRKINFVNKARNDDSISMNRTTERNKMIIAPANDFNQLRKTTCVSMNWNEERHTRQEALILDLDLLLSR